MARARAFDRAFLRHARWTRARVSSTRDRTRASFVAIAFVVVLWALFEATTTRRARRGASDVVDRARRHRASKSDAWVQAAKRRDSETCAVTTPTRIPEGPGRRKLFGFARARGALAALPGEGVTVSTPSARRKFRTGSYGDALDRYGFYITDPVLSDEEADDAREHVLATLRETQKYGSENGCLGKLANCEERFDLSLRLTTTTTRTLNAIVSRLQPMLVDIFGDDECELIELSALVTCKGSPTQRLHSDADGVKGQDRIVSVFVSLQDTPPGMGPSEVFFNSPNAVSQFDYYSALYLMRSLASELNSTDSLRAHGLGELYIGADGAVNVPEGGASDEELKFFNEHVRVDEMDNTVAFHPPWDSTPSARIILGVAAATRQGSALIYDSRTKHRGGRNTRSARVQLMFSFQTKRAFMSGSTFTMRRRYLRIERVPLTLTERATLRTLGQDIKVSPTQGAWHLRVFGKIRLKDFPLLPDAADNDLDWIDEDVVTDIDNTLDFDIDAMGLNGDQV